MDLLLKTWYNFIYFTRIKFILAIIIYINNIILFFQKLKTHKNIKIKSFNIVNYINVKGNATQQALITYYVKPTNTIYLVLFDLENGNDIKSTSIRYKLFFLIFKIIIRFFLIN